MDKRKPLLGEKTAHAEGKDRRKVGEVAGGTAAECAAIWFCCPCAMMDLVVLAVYKVPTGLCKEGMMKKKALSQQQQQESTSSSCGISSSFDESEIGRSDVDEAVGDESTVDFETEMWNRFYGAGFWRSSSKREYLYELYVSRPEREGCDEAKGFTISQVQCAQNCGAGVQFYAK